MWTEIFKTGTHRDANGNVRLWQRKDLDLIASQYNPNKHEAPVVIGHPKDNAPAYGWIEALQREGDSLWARIKDLVPEFKDLVKRKLYKKKSISLYPDLSLRHVGFLGAMPPAVKGLEDIAFSDEEAIMTIEDSTNDGDRNVVFSEEELKTLTEKARAEGAEQGRRQAAAEFKEREREIESAARQKDIVAFVEGKVANGILPPAFLDMGIIEFMEGIDQGGAEIEFKEGNRKPPVEWFMDFIDKLEQFPIFGEIATKRRAGSKEAHAQVEMGRAIASKVKPAE